MRTFFILAYCGFTALVGAQADEMYGPPPPPPKPMLPSLYCPEPSKDWGTVLSGEDVEVTFELVNRGEGILKIENVRPSCGCQAARYDKTIAPGAKGEVVIKMKTRGIRSKTRKSATVTSNDPKNKKFTLTMGGEVKPLVKFEPEYPTLEGLRGEQLKTTVKMKREVAGDLKILSMKPQGTTSLLKHEYREIKAGEEFEIDLIVATDATTKVYYYGRPETLNIKAKLGEKELDIPLRAQLKLVETINPSKKYLVFRRPEVELFYKGQGKTPEQSLILKGWQGREFGIKDVKVTARMLGFQQGQAPEESPLTVSFDKGVRKNEHEIKVALLKVPAEKKRATSCELVINTDDALTPELKIRATVYFPYRGSTVARPTVARPTFPGRTTPSPSVRSPLGTSTTRGTSGTPLKSVIRPSKASKAGTNTGAGSGSSK